MFPLGLIIFGQLRSSLLARTLSLLACVVIISFIAYSLMEGFVIWLFGVIVFNIYSRSQYNAPFTLVTLSAVLFGSSLLLSKTGYSTIFSPLSSDVVCAIFFSLFLISINNKTCPERYQRSIAAASKWLSDFSYSLYLFHFPVVLLIYAVFYSDQQLAFNAVNILKFGLWMVLLVAIGYGFWWLFEKRTENIRKFLHSKVLRPSIRPI
jgi:peptidoglycan/LPS O-acetylase OafA/YrhL